MGQKVNPKGFPCRCYPRLGYPLVCKQKKITDIFLYEDYQVRKYVLNQNFMLLASLKLKLSVLAAV